MSSACTSCSDVRDAFLELVREKAEKVTAGLEDGVSYGPMITPGQVEIVRRHIDAAVAGGATALVGGPESVKPPFVHPVVLVDVPEDNAAVCEETFGPVVVINTVEDVDDAIRQSNGTSFGLGASVFSKRRGAEIASRMRSGGVTVNAVLSFVGMPSVPFGGVGDSGFGRFHGDAGLREFTFAKSTVRKKFSMGPNVQEFPRTAEHYDVIRKTIKMRYERKFRG